jgi:hypothetical protein
MFLKIQQFFEHQYVIYHLRWQISAWVMFPIMTLLVSFLPLWANLMVGQFFGAIIFWKVDKLIFKNRIER